MLLLTFDLTLFSFFLTLSYAVHTFPNPDVSVVGASSGPMSRDLHDILHDILSF